MCKPMGDCWRCCCCGFWNSLDHQYCSMCDKDICSTAKEPEGETD